MLLFFHDIGMPPLWILIVWLIAFLSCPFFFIKGLHGLIRERTNSTFMYTFLVMFIIALAYHLLWIFIHTEISFFAFMTIPFGTGVVPFLALIEIPMFLTVLLAISINFVSIYGAIGIVEKIIAKRK